MIGWEIVLLMFVVGLVLLIFMGVPVAVAFLTVNLVATTLIYGFEIGLDQVVTAIPRFLGNYSIVPIVLFVLMGELLYHAGLATRTVDALSKLLGAIPGRLSLLTMGTGTTFSVLSGSALATTSMLSSLMLPEMRERGYSKEMSAGPILAAGGLAMVVPPSAMSIMVGTIGGISIGQLLIAGIIPGIMLAAIAVLYIIFRCWQDPSRAPIYEVASVSGSQRVVALVRDVVPLLSIVVVILGLIVLGWATPTESAAVGTVTAFILAFAYGKLAWPMTVKAFSGTMKIAGMILFIMAGAAAYSRLVAGSGATRGLLELVSGLNIPPIFVVVLLLLVVIAMGAPLEQVSIMLITLPVFVPIVEALGYSPVWFGILFLICMDLANLTPPLGLTLYVILGAAPADYDMPDVVRAAFPFIMVDIVVIVLLLAFPGLVTWLPDLLLN